MHLIAKINKNEYEGHGANREAILIAIQNLSWSDVIMKERLGIDTFDLNMEPFEDIELQWKHIMSILNKNGMFIKDDDEKFLVYEEPAIVDR